MRSVSMTVCAAEKTDQQSEYRAARDANSASSIVPLLLLLLDARVPTSSCRGAHACVAEEKEQLLRLRCKEKDADATEGEHVSFADAADPEEEDEELAATVAAVARA